MTIANGPYITRGGLPGLEHVPFGMHACHFYRDRQQLVAALVPYFVAGLRANERCLWVAAPPLPKRDALAALRGVDGVDVDEAAAAGALRILDFDQWYTDRAGLNGRDIARSWLAEEERALADGHSGLRIAGNTSFLAPDNWSTFLAYEQNATACFAGRRIVALCSYALAQCDDRKMSDVIHAHHCALEGPDAHGQVVALPPFRRLAKSRR